jgi:uncharacterized protein YpmS
MKHQSKSRAGYGFLMVLALLIVMMACNLPQRKIADIPTPIPVTTASAQEMEDILGDAVKGFEETGTIDIEISESQLTSYIAVQLESQPDPVFQNPQIGLRDGEIQLSGDVTQGNLALPMKARIAVSATSSGNLEYEITSASLGPLPLPQSIIDQLSTQIDQVIETNFSSQLAGINISEVVIANGVMTIKGQAR